MTPTTPDTLRVAWLGPPPDDVGGVPGMTRQMLLGLADSGVDLELFVSSPRTEFIQALARRPNVLVSSVTSGWKFDKWYSSSPASKLLTNMAMRAHLGDKLARRLAERHAQRPFDVVYRLSQIELFALRKHRRQLPPIVLHPEVHAHGELRYHWRERAMARRCEGRAFFGTIHAYLSYRSLLQRRDLSSVAMVIAPSRRFGDLIAADCGVARDRIRVIPNVVDLDRFSPADVPPPPAPVRLLFVSRMAVRKGVEQIVDLSHRLGDLAGRVQIDCVGGASLFSNYIPLMDELNPAVARYLGQVPTTELPDLYRSAHGCLQPSLYEPFAITVGEAFASGLPVVASDEVGAAEGADPSFCRVHAAGDVGAMEREVRKLVGQIERGWDPERRHAARRHAETYLCRDHFARELLAAIGSMRG